VKSRSATLRKQTTKGQKPEAVAITAGWNTFNIILFFLAFAVPLIVLPHSLDNAFNTPKTCLIIIGTFVLLGILILRCIKGSGISVPQAGTPLVLFLLILLNLSSFFYTDNYYYTAVAAAIQVSCLLSLYFVSVYIDGKNALRLLLIAAAAGFLVSLETWLQFFNVFVLFPWAHPHINVMGTIGNSNYLGAYLLFVLFIASGLFFLVRGRYRFIYAGLFLFVFAAFIFSRARASWLGFFLAMPLFLLLLKLIFNFSVWEYVRSRPKRLLVYGLATVVLICILWSVAPKRLHEMLRWEQVGQSLTFKLRTEKYSRGSLWLFKQNPLFGTGLWSYRNLVYSAQAEINKSDPEFFKNYPEPKPRRVHNEYLETLNDGGLLAAAVLVLFISMILSHGWKVIRNEAIDRRDRIISATAFSSIIAILIAALLFFPFRVNTTLFMTVLMLGLMEGLYLRNYDLLSTARISLSPGTRTFSTLILILFLGGFVWFTALKPFLGELEHFKYKKALSQGNLTRAEEHLLKAIDWDPRNTAYSMYAAQLYMGPLQKWGHARDFIERAIVDFNGDVTLYSLHYIKGLLKFQIGSLFEARDAFDKALYYYPDFGEAKLKLEEVRKVIKDHDQVLIKFR
jgi:O-antigen ligase